MIEFSNEELNMILSALSSKTRACGYLGPHMTPEVMEKYSSLQSKIQKYLWEQIRSGYKRLKDKNR